MRLGNGKTKKRMNYISSKHITKEWLESHQSHILLGSQIFYQGMPLCTPWEQYWSIWYPQWTIRFHIKLYFLPYKNVSEILILYVVLKCITFFLLNFIFYHICFVFLIYWISRVWDNRCLRRFHWYSFKPSDWIFSSSEPSAIMRYLVFSHILHT